MTQDDNDTDRINQLLPLVRTAADDVTRHLKATNAYPELLRDIIEYRRVIDRDTKEIPWGAVFGLGVMLENAAVAAQRQSEERLLPPLEDTAQAALDSLLMLHGPLVLATADGRELQDQADRFHLTTRQHEALRANVKALAMSLKRDSEIVDPSAAELLARAAEAIGTGPHPERGTAFGMATLKNAMTVIIAAASLGAIIPAGGAVAGGLGAALGASIVAAVTYEGIKKSKWFSAANAALGEDVDRVVAMSQAQIAQKMTMLIPFRRFVIANEEPLRRIAENSTQMRWMLGYIDLIVRTNDRDR